MTLAIVGNVSLAGNELKSIRDATDSIAAKSNALKSEALEKEIIELISSQLPNLDVEPAIEAILQYVVETKKVPGDSEFSITANGILMLDLEITTTPEMKTGYRLILRHPALRKLEDGTVLLHERWKPAENERWSWNGSNWESTKFRRRDEQSVTRQPPSPSALINNQARRIR